MSQKSSQNPPEEWISGAELSRRLRCSPSKISYLFQDGIMNRRARDKRYNWHEVKYILGEGGVVLSSQPVESAPDKPQPLSAGLPEDASATQSRAYWQAKKSQEDYYKQRISRLHLQGKLIKRSTAEAFVGDLASTIRQQLSPLGGRLAAVLAAETNPRKCQDIVEDAIREALITSSSLFQTRQMKDEEVLEEALEEVGETKRKRRSSKKQSKKQSK